MASRQRTGGIIDFRPRQTNRSVYDDFNPKIDTNEGEEARVVSIHLPGFIKEQMRITAEQGNNIRVQGQRPLLNNRWSRFVQLLPVPQSCEVNKIHAKFHNGILTITMPKEAPKTLMSPKDEKTTKRDSITDTPPKATESKVVPPTVSEPNQRAAAAAELRAQKDQEKTGQTPTSAEKMPERAGPEEKMVKRVDPATERDVTKMGGSPIAQKEVTEPKGQKGLEKTDQTHSVAEKMSQKTGSEEKMVKKVDPAAEIDAKKVGSSPITQKGHGEGPAKASTEADARKVQEAVSSSQSESHKKVASEMVKGPEMGKKFVEKALEKTKESTEKGKERERAPPPAEVAAVSKALEDGKREIEKRVSGDAKEKKPMKDDGEASIVNKLGIKKIAETAKQTVSNVIKSLDEDDRQMLINIGAAVMVLVALGAYISYGNFGSSTEREN